MKNYLIRKGLQKTSQGEARLLYRGATPEVLANSLPENNESNEQPRQSADVENQQGATNQRVRNTLPAAAPAQPVAPVVPQVAPVERPTVGQHLKNSANEVPS